MIRRKELLLLLLITVTCAERGKHPSRVITLEVSSPVKRLDDSSFGSSSFGKSSFGGTGSFGGSDSFGGSGSSFEGRSGSGSTFGGSGGGGGLKVSFFTTDKLTGVLTFQSSSSFGDSGGSGGLKVSVVGETDQRIYYSSPQVVLEDQGVLSEALGLPGVSEALVARVRSEDRAARVVSEALGEADLSVDQEEASEDPAVRVLSEVLDQADQEALEVEDQED